MLSLSRINSTQLLIFCLIFGYIKAAPDDSDESDEIVASTAKKFLPSQDALESVGVTFLDALIKAGQIEMAKGAFKTQLGVLKKVQPDQYKKYKNIPISKLAADAVFQQAQQAQNQPKSGNRFIDMLNENGIPIASSLKGIQQALKTQKEIEESDPAEQVAKAVFEKFQKQILPGLVANMIAGKNPFQIPQRPELQNMSQNQQRMLKMQHEQAMKEMEKQNLQHIPKVQGDQFDLNPLIRQMKGSEVRRSEKASEEYDEEESKEETKSKDTEYEEDQENSNNAVEETDDNEEETSQENPKFKYKRTKRQTRLIEPIEDEEYSRADRAEMKLGKKAAMLLGIYEGFPDLVEDEDEQEIRKQRPKIPLDLVQKILQSERLRVLLGNKELAYKIADPEGFLEAKKPIEDPNPKPGFVTPRPIPQRPRKMLPLLIGEGSDLLGPKDDETSVEPEIAPDESHEYEDESSISETTTPSTSESLRRNPVKSSSDIELLGKLDVLKTGDSRTLNNLLNNPGVASVFHNSDVIDHLRRPTVLTDDQRLGVGIPKKQHIIHPRMNGVKNFDGKEMPPNEMDMKVKQVIEEREIPPLFYIPTGRHTRLRWTGATEKEIPGLGTRLVLPSLDPTMPAINSVMSTQGKRRDEYDSTFKIPNYWSPGDVFGIDAKTVQESLIGGDGTVDFPAMQSGMTFG